MCRQIIIIVVTLLVALQARAAGLKPFSIEFDLYYGWLHLGKAEYVLQPVQDKVFDFRFHSVMRFLVYWDERDVTTRFVVDDQGRLLPQQYDHQREGTGNDYRERIVYNDEQGQIHARFIQHEMKVPYDALIKDGLLVQLQLMQDIKAGKPTLNYRVFESIGVMERQFINLGDDVVELDDKQYRAIKVQVERPEKNMKTLMWFASELGYLPILLEHYNNGKKRFNARLTGYTLDEPVKH